MSSDWVVAAAVTAALLITGLFAAQHLGQPRPAGLRVVGHFRFGPGCQPQGTGDGVGSHRIVRAWATLLSVSTCPLSPIWSRCMARSGQDIAIAAVAASVVMLVAVPLAVLAANQDWPLGEVLMQSRDILPLAWLVAAGAAGEALRQAERRVEQVERSREEAALRRADEERLRIARELHDSLTHQISVIKLQAEVAVHLARKQGNAGAGVPAGDPRGRS